MNFNICAQTADLFHRPLLCLHPWSPPSSPLCGYCTLFAFVVAAIVTACAHLPSRSAPLSSWPSF
jgi:hypothetical protein